MSDAGGGNSSLSSLGKTAFGELAVQSPTPEVLIHFPYNLNTDVVSTTTVASGSVTHSGQFAVISSGAATSSSGLLRSNRLLEYQPGIGGLCRFTCIYTTGVAGNTQIAGVGNSTDGFFFGYNGTSFGVLRRVGGSDNWIAQSSWNVDKYDGTGISGQTLDTTKGNVFQIKYQWLGFGAISFFIENQSTGALDLVHRINYANQNTTVSINNPSLPFYAISENTSNSTNITMKLSSMGLFIDGQINSKSYTRNAIDNTKTISTQANVLTIRNKSTYQSITNAVQVQPDFLTIAADGTKNVTIRVYVNATLGGTPSYADVSTNTSVVDYDIAGTTVTGGTLVATMQLSKDGSQVIAFNDFGFILSPGSTLTFAATSAANNDVSVGISWQERFS